MVMQRLVTKIPISMFIESANSHKYLWTRAPNYPYDPQKRPPQVNTKQVQQSAKPQAQRIQSFCHLCQNTKYSLPSQPRTHECRNQMLADVEYKMQFCQAECKQKVQSREVQRMKGKKQSKER